MVRWLIRQSESYHSSTLASLAPPASSQNSSHKNSIQGGARRRVFSSRFIDPQFLWRAQWMALTEWRPKGLMHPEKSSSAYPKDHSYWGTTTWIDLKHFIVEWAHFSIDTTLYLKFKMYIMLHRFEGHFFSKCTISIWLAVIIHMGRQYHGFI